MNSITKSALLGASVLALSAPGAAFGQAAPPVESPSANTQSNFDEDIIVTARRREESVQDVPAVVNAVTADQVAKLNFRQFQDVQTVVPGLTLATTAQGTGGGATLRGVNFDINASGNNPSVEFYQNDAPITAGVILQQLYDVGQIEVLRGPQGTLRGRASPSGSITITTRTPDLYRVGGYVSSTANDIGTINANGALSIPIIEGKAAIRIAGLINEDDFNRVRTIKHTLDSRDPYSETQSGRITAVVSPFDALRLEGSYERLTLHSRGYNQVESFSVANPAAPPSPVLIRAADRLSDAENSRRVRQNYEIFNARAQVSLFGQKLVYQFQHYNQGIDSYLPQETAEAFPNFDFGQTVKSRIRSESHEIRLQNDERVLGTFDYVLGAFANTNDVPTDLIQPTPVFLPAFLGGSLAVLNITNIQRRGHTNEKSGFGNLTAHIGASTQISGGLRYISYKSDGSLNILPGPAIPDPAIKDHHLIYTASVQHNFTRDIMVYASTGTSYRPGLDVVGDFSVAQSALERSFQHIPPETSQSYEAGIKTSFMNNRAHLNVSGYHQTFKNYPYRVPGNGVYYLTSNAIVAPGGGVTIAQGTGQFNFVGAVPVEVNGVEGELGYDVSHAFKVNLVAAYSLGKIKNGTAPCNDLNRDGIPDAISSAPSVAQLQAAYGANNVGACKISQRSAFQSPFSASATAEYDHPISNHVDGYLRGLVSFNGQAQGDPTNPYDDVGAYALANLYLGIRDAKGGWEISLFAKNLFDEAKVLTRSNPNITTIQVLQPPTFRSAAAQTITGTYTDVTTTPPREFGVNLRFAFGSR